MEQKNPQKRTITGKLLKRLKRDEAIETENRFLTLSETFPPYKRYKCKYLSVPTWKYAQVLVRIREQKTGGSSRVTLATDFYIFSTQFLVKVI